MCWRGDRAFAVLAVSIFALIGPEHYLNAVTTAPVLILTLCVWGGFLGLVAILVGTLCDQRAEHIRELHDAYIGVIEILSKYLQAADQYTKAHSIRVAELSEAIAVRMKLPFPVIEDVRVGALLHDIGKVEISTKLIQKASTLTQDETGEVATHTVRGPRLSAPRFHHRGAVPIIMHHHDHFSSDSITGGLHGEKVPIGRSIVAVADAYDAIITDRPYARADAPGGRRHYP